MLDDIDIKILNMLQNNGRVKRNVIAEQIGLSIPSVSERLHKLEEKMYRHARDLEFEEAARLRDQIRHLKKGSLGLAD